MLVKHATLSLTNVPRTRVPMERLASEESAIFHVFVPAVLPVSRATAKLIIAAHLLVVLTAFAMKDPTHSIVLANLVMVGELVRLNVLRIVCRVQARATAQSAETPPSWRIASV